MDDRWKDLADGFAGELSGNITYLADLKWDENQLAIVSEEGHPVDFHGTLQSWLKDHNILDIFSWLEFNSTPERADRLRARIDVLLKASRRYDQELDGRKANLERFRWTLKHEAVYLQLLAEFIYREAGETAPQEPGRRRAITVVRKGKPGRKPDPDRDKRIWEAVQEGKAEKVVGREFPQSNGKAISPSAVRHACNRHEKAVALVNK